MKSFLVCGISSNLDGTQHDMVSDDIPDADVDADDLEVKAEDEGSDVDNLARRFI